MVRRVALLAFCLAACASPAAPPAAQVVADVAAADWFAPGTSTLTADAQSRLRELAATLRGHRVVVTLVEVDPLHVARLPTSRNLGMLRAQSVRAFLVDGCGLAAKDLEIAKVRSADHDAQLDRLAIRLAR